MNKEKGGRCIIFSAPSGAGKTSIVRYLLNERDDLKFSVSACNRPRREGEVDGKDYYFLSTKEFKEKINKDEFVEWEEVYKDNFYGTLKSEIERIWDEGYHVIFDVDVKGGLSLTKFFKEKALAIFVKSPSLEVLEERLRKRNTESEEKIRKRMNKAKEEIGYSQWFDAEIMNEDLEVACNEAKLAVKTFLNHN